MNDNVLPAKGKKKLKVYVKPAQNGKVLTVMMECNVLHLPYVQPAMDQV